VGAFAALSRRDKPSIKIVIANPLFAGEAIC